MNGDYVAIIPRLPDFVPSEDAVAALTRVLSEREIIRFADGRWTSGTKLGEFLKDPRPVIRQGRNVLESADSPVSWHVHPYFRGHSGLNFEPIACRFCGAELPFDEMLAVLGAADGTRARSAAEMTLICFHCKKPNDALKQDYGMSGGFARFEFVIEVPTNRFMEPNRDLLKLASEALGTECRLIQIIQD